MRISSLEPLEPVLESVGSSTVGLGVLEVCEKGSRIRLPLAAVEITARVASRIALVTVSQRFRNEYREPIEAIYICPLSGGSSVYSFQMRVGQRLLQGRVAERSAARQEYREALDQGRRAALLEQERNDIFTVHVGNLPPGEEITVTISYSELLTQSDEVIELRLPLVVAPRYIAGQEKDGISVGHGVEPDTDLVPDASRITPPRLLPGFDPQTDLSIQVELESDEQIADLQCSQHAIRVTRDTHTTVTLARERELLNRDFVLRWRTVRRDFGSELVYHPVAEGGYIGALSLLCKQGPGQTVPRDVVFVLDRSGSMSGIKMASAVRACAGLLTTLRPIDRFAIVAFDNQCEWMPGSQPDDPFCWADEAGIARGRTYLRQVDARGGTELGSAIAEALRILERTCPAEPNQAARQSIIVLLTDGQVGDERTVLRRLSQSKDSLRVYTIGIDTAVNAGFLKKVARLRRGTCMLVEPGTDLEQALRSVARDIGTPRVTSLQLEGSHLQELAPEQLPDLYEGHVATIFFHAKAPDPVRVIGSAADGQPFHAIVQGRVVDLPAIGQLWARTRITDLEDQLRMGGANAEQLKAEMVRLSIAWSVLTRLTAFVVVDANHTIVDASKRREIVQPVHMPDQWQVDQLGMGAMWMPSWPGMELGQGQAPSGMAWRARMPANLSPSSADGLQMLFLVAKTDHSERAREAFESFTSQSGIAPILEALRSFIPAFNLPGSPSQSTNPAIATMSLPQVVRELVAVVGEFKRRRSTDRFTRITSLLARALELLDCDSELAEKCRRVLEQLLAVRTVRQVKADLLNQLVSVVRDLAIKVGLENEKPFWESTI